MLVTLRDDVIMPTVDTDMAIVLDEYATLDEARRALIAHLWAITDASWDDVERAVGDIEVDEHYSINLPKRERRGNI